MLQNLGDYGYDCQVGHCSMIKTEGVSPIPRLFVFAIGFLLPFLTIVFSNIGLWKIVRSSSTALMKDDKYVGAKVPREAAEFSNTKDPSLQ